ncbi:hypothetical protein [Staphylococcus gallinarum]|uniref:hypothetical protein n=1 Tax=Staphylococcus gallinarum TaxID=1293 RepID=UPI0015FCE89E
MYKNYKMSLLTLPMETEILIPENGIAQIVSHLVETILENEFNHFYGAFSYHPLCLLPINFLRTQN